ncbi:hypothetical protein BP00DRAFT_76512 [Aspergillus indologenus CBS 114.80]|uniref:Uncharacterized protein n=1 Tax=Aspergillus indologenus CBS 114.80 TaxID=1450541 RepID=A0A2V5IGG4_9EURO|nr:hypothetical protein BP00DRAFT_76512 [Aspergillus indologenus CBS 114.80]
MYCTLQQSTPGPLSSPPSTASIMSAPVAPRDASWKNALTSDIAVLKSASTEGLQAFQSETDSVRRSLEEHANGPNAQSDASWQTLLRRTIDQHKQNSEKRWDGLVTCGLTEIEKLPPTLRAGLAAIGAFVGKVIDALRGFVARLGDFIIAAWEKIKELGHSIAAWLSSAWTVVRGVYSSIFDVQSGVVPQSFVPLGSKAASDSILG